MDESIKEKLEELAMLIIANSGAARSGSFEALEQAKKGNFKEAGEFLKRAESSMQEAHEAHRELLRMDADGQVPQTSVLLCHAQDHLMGSALAQDLIKEMLCLYQSLNALAPNPADGAAE